MSTNDYFGLPMAAQSIDISTPLQEKSCSWPRNLTQATDCNGLLGGTRTSSSDSPPGVQMMGAHLSQQQKQNLSQTVSHTDNLVVALMVEVKLKNLFESRLGKG